MTDKSIHENLYEKVAGLKQIEEALSESEERFSLFMDYLPAIVFIKDEKSRTLYVNKYMNDVLGAKKWIGKTPLDLFPKDLADAMISDDKKTLDEVHRVIVETVPDKYGINRIYQTHKFRINRGDKPPLLGGIALDITEPRQLEDALLASEKEYRETLNDLPVGVVVHSSSTSILLSNPEASNILGLTQEQISGKKAIDSAWKFVHEDSSIIKIEDYPVSKVFSTKKPLQDYIVGIIRPDRDYITWVIAKAIPVFSNNNELKKVVVNFVDITERKQAEKGREKLLKALHESLENVKTLNGLLPICGHCKKIRDDKGYWSQIEGFIEKYSYAKFSHGMCPECADELYGQEGWYLKMKKNKE